MFDDRNPSVSEDSFEREVGSLKLNINLNEIQSLCNKRLCDEVSVVPQLKDKDTAL